MKTGQYIRRAVGYFIKLIVLVIVLYLLLFVTGTARVSAGYFVGELFATPRGLMLLGALAVLAACYPMFGYVSRRMAADLREDRVRIVSAFHADGYVLEKEQEGESMTFRAGGLFRRIWLTFDDRITVRSCGEGFVEIEGLRKEVVTAQFRINTYIQNKRHENND